MSIYIHGFAIDERALTKTITISQKSYFIFHTSTVTPVNSFSPCTIHVHKLITCSIYITIFGPLKFPISLYVDPMFSRCIETHIGNRNYQETQNYYFLCICMCKIFRKFSRLFDKFSLCRIIFDYTLGLELCSSTCCATFYRVLLEWKH